MTDYYLIDRKREREDDQGKSVSMYLCAGVKTKLDSKTHGGMTRAEREIDRAGEREKR